MLSNAIVDSDRYSELPMLVMGAILFLCASAVADNSSWIGAVTDPTFHEGIDYSEDNFSYRIRHYTYMTDEGAAAGLVASAMFTLDATSTDVWQYMKDFNSFEGPFGIRYVTDSGERAVWGDMYDSEEHDNTISGIKLSDTKEPTKTPMALCTGALFHQG